MLVFGEGRCDFLAERLHAVNEGRSADAEYTESGQLCVHLRPGAESVVAFQFRWASLETSKQNMCECVCKTFSVSVCLSRHELWLMSV